jgi:hypothetical protein
MQNKKVSRKDSDKLLDNVGQLYAYTSIDPNYKYDSEIVRKFGQDTIDAALKMAPLVLAYKEKLKQIAEEIESSDEGKILLASISHGRGYAGYHNTHSNVSDLFKIK